MIMRLGKSWDLKCLSLFQNILFLSLLQKREGSSWEWGRQKGGQETLTNEPLKDLRLAHPFDINLLLIHHHCKKCLFKTTLILRCVIISLCSRQGSWFPFFFLALFLCIVSLLQRENWVVGSNVSHFSA